MHAEPLELVLHPGCWSGQKTGTDPVGSRTKSEVQTG